MRLALSVALASSLAWARKEDIAKNFYQVLQNSSVPVPPQLALTRSFGSAWAAQFIDTIDEYGCWCYFGDDHGKGRGPAANEIDRICKKLHHGYSCILFDAEQEDPNPVDYCIPWREPYESGSGLGLLAEDPLNDNNVNAIRKSCARANQNNDCARRTCIVENFFIIELVQAFLAGVQYDPNLKHWPVGDWDRIDDCQHNDTASLHYDDYRVTPHPPEFYGYDPDYYDYDRAVGESFRNVEGNDAGYDDMCCGTYPHRFPYLKLSHAGRKRCCGEKTYNPDLKQCCPGEVIKQVC